MTDDRPDPDQLLAQVKAQEAAAQRGRLRIYFGASAGVGKTYAMLTAARALRNEGKDVVVGLLETHGRKETEALLQGLEILPRDGDRVPGPHAARVRPRCRAGAPPGADPRRRTRAHERAGLAPSQALAGYRRAARRRHRRLHDAQRPAPRKPERRRRRHHRHHASGRRCPMPSSTRPTKSCWSTSPPTICSRGSRPARSTCPSRSSAPPRTSSARAT